MTKKVSEVPFVPVIIVCLVKPVRTGVPVILGEEEEEDEDEEWTSPQDGCVCGGPESSLILTLVLQGTRCS